MRYAVFALIPLMGSGCFLELMGATAIQSTLQAEQATTLTRTLEQVKNTKTEVEVNHAIQAYYAETGSYPVSLDALVPSYFSSVPVKPDGTPYGYDASTGTLLDRPMPAPAGGASDARAMQRIQDAVMRYGNDTGYYPGYLEQLVPNYLESLPATAGGLAFLYEPQTGVVSHPNPAAMSQAASPRPRLSGVGGGGSPMMETMTGLGIQQELSNMNNAGTSAAGTAGRGQLDRAIGRQNELQQQALDDIP